MDHEILSYEADIDREFEGLTEKHKTIKSQLETTLSSYFKGAKVKPVTIQGPYRSGKTQLLYHLFKFGWEKDVRLICYEKNPPCHRFILIDLINSL